MKYLNKNLMMAGLNIKYFEYIFSGATMFSVLPQIYKLIKTRMAKDFSIYFIIGMIIVNVLFFGQGFIDENTGLMFGTFWFILYNLVILYFYLFGKQNY